MARFRTNKELKIEKIIMVKCENCNHKFPAEERKENIYCPYCNEKKFTFYTKWRIIADEDIKKRLMRLTPKERRTAIEALVMKEQLHGFGMM
jgi:DNA-directed RNA polymerase subunit RPC12/RpoP